jgi:hypothetical protein
MIRAATWGELVLTAAKLELVLSPAAKGMAYEVDGAVRLVVIFDNWTDGAVQMHQWCEHPRYFSRTMIREVFRYVFGVCGKQVAIGVVRGDNPNALVVDAKLGFKLVGEIRDAYGPGIHMFILQMRRDECRWYKHLG